MRRELTVCLLAVAILACGNDEETTGSSSSKSSSAQTTSTQTSTTSTTSTTSSTGEGGSADGGGGAGPGPGGMGGMLATGGTGGMLATGGMGGTVATGGMGGALATGGAGGGLGGAGGVSPACPAQVLSSVSPQTVNGNNSASAAFDTGSCAGVGPEDSYEWTAPASGTYTIDTFGSSFDTVLYVRDMDCLGSELACNDDSMGTQSLVQITVTQGQTVVIFVDSYSGGGAYTLNITGPLAVCGNGVIETGEQCDDSNTMSGDGCSSTCQIETACPLQILPSAVPQTISGNNIMDPAVTSGSCAGAGPETSYEFTAPSAGGYVFDTLGSPTDTVLYVRDATCSGPELACNDDAVGLTSQVQVFLAAGQTVVVFVDTFAAPGGAFTLNISQSGPCPVNTLPGVSPQTVTGSTSGLPAAFTGTCAGAGPENTLSWTAPASGTYTIDTAGSPYDTVLYVRDVNCGGMELACDDDGGPGVTSQLQVTLVAGQTVVIFVDSFGSTGGSYTLNIAGP